MSWPDAPVTVVVSDLHANARALRRALELARAGRMDRLVILGDLLTYGVDIDETLDIVREETEKGAVLISGNHDQLYFDLAKDERAYYTKLPEWLRESADWTFERLDRATFGALPWLEEFVENGILYAHANPFGYGNWRYLNTPADLVEAGRAVTERGVLAGVFGHNHRAICFANEGPLDSADGVAGPVVLNPGSTGQPRSKPPRSTMLRLCSHEGKVWARVETIDYDAAEHVAALRAAAFSDLTKETLCRFFE